MTGADLSFVTVGLSLTVANGFPPLQEDNGGEKNHNAGAMSLNSSSSGHQPLNAQTNV